MATHEAKAYQEPGTPDEQSRRTFLANATVAVGGIIGLVLAVPLAASLIPESLLKPDKAGGTWADLTPQDVTQIQGATKTPVKITFSFQYQDGYLPASPDTEFVWGVKLSPQMMQNFQQSRPDLFTLGGKVAYAPFDQQMGFAIFSSVCPHLGCRFEWTPSANRFICPCHGSQFDLVGQHLAGPAPRGLDPLPFREQSGKAQITWIQYKAQQPDRIIVSYN